MDADPRDCPFTARIDAYHDGELRPADRAAMGTHVAGCAACAAALEFRRRLSRAIQAEVEVCLRGSAAGGTACGSPDRHTPALDALRLKALEQRGRSAPARARQQELVRLGWGLSAAAAAALAVGLLFPRERAPRAAGEDWTAALAAALFPLRSQRDPSEAELIAEGGEEAELALAIIEGLDGRGPRAGEPRGR